LILELLSENTEKVLSSGGSFILNMNLGLWTIVLLLLIFGMFGLIIWKIPGINEILGIHKNNLDSHKLD